MALVLFNKHQKSLAGDGSPHHQTDSYHNIKQHRHSLAGIEVLAVCGKLRRSAGLQTGGALNAGADRGRIRPRLQFTENVSLIPALAAIQRNGGRACCVDDRKTRERRRGIADPDDAQEGIGDADTFS